MSTPASFLGNLVGVSFRPKQVKLVISALEPGNDLLIERQYDNAWDENAVRISVSLPRELAERLDVLDIKEPWADGKLFIGFVERGVAAYLARWMDEGYVYSAKVKSPTGDAKAPWLLELEPTGEKGEAYGPELSLDEPTYPAGSRYIYNGHTESDDDIPY